MKDNPSFEEEIVLKMVVSFATRRSLNWVSCSTCYTKTEGMGWVVLKTLKLDFPWSNAGWAIRK